MASFFRWRIADKVIPFLKQSNENSNNFLPSIISSTIKVNRRSRKNPQLLLLWDKIVKIEPKIESCFTPLKLAKLLRNQGLPTAEGFTDIEVSEYPVGLSFTVDKHVFSKIVLTDICGNEEPIAKSSCLFQNVYPKRILVQYNLPSVGEMFSMSDFRNVVCTNFIANINEFVGHEVIKVCNISDWCLESAILLTGYNQFGIEEELLKDPINHLSQVYKASHIHYENDLNFQNEVNVCFESMERKNSKFSSDWHYLRRLCLAQNESLFKKLGLPLENIHCDSSYSTDIKNIYEDLVQKNFISQYEKIKIKIDLPEGSKLGQSYCCESMDSIIYRVCSAIHFLTVSKANYNFDIMYCVSSSSQEMIYALLFSLINKLGFKWLDEIRHVELKDLSNLDYFKKKNTSVEDVLNQAKGIMLNNLRNQLHLQTDENLENMAEALSYASVHMYDLKHRRNANYSFHLSEILHLGRDSGAAFQLCHAGLKGIQEDSEIIFNTDIDTSPLLEPNVQQLILHLSRFDEIIHTSYISLEPSFIYQYLSTLWYHTNKAADSLKLDLKSDRLIVIKARLLLLSATLKILQKSLNLLGLKPYVNEYTQPTFM